MNVIIGRIYQAAWGRYVGHREGVLRSLDTAGAFSIHPDPDLHVDTGEDYVERTGTRAAELPRRDGVEEADGRGRNERVAPLGDAGEARPAGPRGAQEDLLVHERQEESGLQPQAPVVPLQGVVPVPTDAAGDGRPALTLGGHRPGAYVITSRDDLWWRPCLSRAEGGIPHVYFLEPASWPSLYCPRCRDPHTVAEVAEQVRELVATGKAAEARALFTDTPIAKLFFQITIRKITASPQTGRLGHSPGSSTSRDEATAGDSRTRTPAAGVTAGETAPSGNPERDDPKAEVGSFEPPAPWRPRYRDRADWEEWKNERAAICEYLGGMQRKYAELAALRLAGDAP